jgi:cobalamin-dependent methionine synthase I
MTEFLDSKERHNLFPKTIDLKLHLYLEVHGYFPLYPKQSTTAIITYHPAARYFKLLTI